MVGRDSDTVASAVLPARETGSLSFMQFARRCFDRAKPAHRIAAPEALRSFAVFSGRSTVTVVPIPRCEITWNVPP